MISKKAQRELKYIMPLSQAARLPRYWPSFIAIGLLRAVILLPVAAQRAIGTLLGLLTMSTNNKRRHIVQTNLAMCFPALGDNGRKRMLREHFKAAGRSLIDLGFLAFASERRLVSKTRLTGIEHFRHHLAQGHNIILLVPHVVGMNLAGTFLCREHEIFSMTKAQKDPVFNWLLDKARGRFGGKTILRHVGIRPVVKGIREGTPFYYSLDEDYGPEQSVFAPFFGVPRATLDTLGRLAEMTRAVVIPCFTRQLPGGEGGEIILYPPLENYPTGDRNEDAARMNAAIEAGLRDMPEQYMWTLRLFKTRPDHAPSPY